MTNPPPTNHFSVNDGTFCRFNYTHSQPQWREVMQMAQRSASPAFPFQDASGNPLVVRRLHLSQTLECWGCGFSMRSCICLACGVCTKSMHSKKQRHCMRCRRPTCSSCLSRKRHVHGFPKPVSCCDQCAAPWALANLSKREERGLFWGLYVLRRAGEMPRLCINPACCLMTYHPICYQCGFPTVMTRPHFERLVRTGSCEQHRVREVDLAEMDNRTNTLSGAQPELVEECFRACFHQYEELAVFRNISSTSTAHRFLLSMIASSVAYEYDSAPNMTLKLSDVPYARLLRIVEFGPRFTILEAPGKLRFIAFPGTHNWRTRLVDLRFSETTRELWKPVISGVSVDASGNSIMVSGGVAKFAEYTVHSGFATEASETGLDLDQLIQSVKDGYKLVLSGHSLGGVVAQLLTIELILREPSLFFTPEGVANTDRLLCVALGAPMAGNYQLVSFVEQGGMTDFFHSLVYRSDVVPRICCGDEITWDVATKVLRAATSAAKHVHRWFGGRWGNAGTNNAATAPLNEMGEDEEEEDDDDDEEATGSPRVPHHEITGCGTTGPMAEAHAAGLSLEDYVDSTIRTGRTVRVMQEDHPTQEEILRRDESLHHAISRVITPCSSLPSMEVARASGEDSDSRRRLTAAEVVDEAADEPDDIMATVEMQETHRRVHRRFAPFGMYHFLEYGDSTYFASNDSETVFGLLKSGPGRKVLFIDHSVASYNRATMIHLYAQSA